ncbi:hypothetical protein GGD65_006073 [Bradyrhizobium sp. CIR18]|uniref:hypothetical protein n=1 Tax=Bradyrhizobium sp. CIR18 TaxID=2663839 RepID=UPI00160606E3|nr:hypothetical protein [Bradyrhizobium sp. CIR18]MBB4365009.1 hypothetical protein [Bradyrhizobium sp. CIR18]
MGDLEYLGRNLNQRSYDAAEAFKSAMNRVMAEANAHGRLMSGSTLSMMETMALEVFAEHTKDAVQFTFNATGTTEGEVANQVSYCLGRMIDMIIGHMFDATTRLVPGNSVDHANKVRMLLNDWRQRAIDDFIHGMVGSNRLKQDPVVNLIANQINSPGGVQQVGVGEFSQSAFSHEHEHLIEAVQKAKCDHLNLPDFCPSRRTVSGTSRTR